MSRDQLTDHLEYFVELGVEGVSREPKWSGRTAPEPSEREHAEYAEHSDGGVGPSVSLLQISRSQAEALAAVREDIGDCTRCKLHKLGRTQIVFGVGNPGADLMFVGEAPGGDEDIQGIPFVGRAGQLLTRIIEAIGMTRDQVYIANVIKCRPPNNRNPEPDEVAQCEQFLFRQIEIIKPKVIVALGKFAAQSLLKTNDPIARLRGREYKYRDAILMPTYHPAFLLRTPSAKREVWQDMKRVRAILSEDAD
jgi:DNA polymerase